MIDLRWDACEKYGLWNYFFPERLAMDLEQIMSKCLMKRNPWDNLTTEEQDQMMYCIRKYRAWCDAWDNVRESHERYKYPYDGPSAWLESNVLITWERLSRKAWGVHA